MKIKRPFPQIGFSITVGPPTRKPAKIAREDPSVSSRFSSFSRPNWLPTEFQVASRTSAIVPEQQKLNSVTVAVGEKAEMKESNRPKKQRTK